MKQDYLDQILIDAARGDREYQRLLERCREAERDYQEIVDRFAPEERERLDRYIGLCEELEHRLTVLALRIPWETCRDSSVND